MKQSNQESLAIVGVGLIGGSIGLAARERGLAKEIVGIGRSEDSLQTALQMGAITDATTDLATGVRAAKLIVVCTPVDQIADHVCEVHKHCPPTSVITDAGSTKAELVRAIESSIGNSAHFVGSHPLAGSHESGAGAARADLMVGRTVIVTPTKKTATRDLNAVSLFWSLLGANVVHMDIDTHDAALAESSHVPHLIAAALAGATSVEARRFAAGGWLDTTRVAGATPELWVPILRQNRQHILAALGRYTTELDAFRVAIDNDDAAELQRLLAAGKQNRDIAGK